MKNILMKYYLSVPLCYIMYYAAMFVSRTMDVANGKLDNVLFNLYAGLTLNSKMLQEKYNFKGPWKN